MEPFLFTIGERPHFFVYALVTVVFSIVLHELAHGWAAIQQGDRTPIVRGHMTVNPVVHMGLMSFVMFLVMGMAFGQMPVDPTRFRSRYGDAIVSAAGPLMNLLLAVVALTVYGLWPELSASDDMGSVISANLKVFTGLFGTFNIALFLLNLIPIPPLDGSTILANFYPAYRRWLREVADPRMCMMIVLAVLLFAPPAYRPIGLALSIYTQLPLDLYWLEVLSR